MAGVSGGGEVMPEVEYMKLSEISRKTSISPRAIKKHLGEIPHYRMTPRSPILVKWRDFQEWMDKRLYDARQDPDVRAILEKIAQVA
jgi:hypothetical protein